MAREINNTQSYFDKLVKCIPTEILGAYIVIAGVIPSDQTKYALTISSIALLLVIPFYMSIVNKVTNKTQIVVSCISFIIWVYTLGGPFTVWGIYKGYIGSIILVFWALMTPMIVKPSDA